MIDEPPENLDIDLMLKEIQESLDRIDKRSAKKREELLKLNFQLLHEDVFDIRSKSRMLVNRLSEVEKSLGELEVVVNSIDVKLDLISKHLGLEKT